MKRITLALPFTCVLALTGCATTNTAHEHGEPLEHAAHHEGEVHAATALTGPKVRSVMPLHANDSVEPREVRVLVDEPALKLVSIALRDGTALPEHVTPSPVTIQAVSGTGTVIAGGERLSLADGAVVVLAANVPHAVEQEAGADLVLLVSHLRQGAPAATP